MEEEWRDIEGYEGLYQISNKGNVFSYKTDKQLKLYIDSNGYATVGLYKNGTHRVCNVHRLVALTYVPNPHNRPNVNHINSNRSDNRVENLEWVTQRENMIHGAKYGNVLGKKGAESSSAKLSWDDVEYIRYLYEVRHYNQAELADLFNVSQSSISNIVNYKTWEV